MWKREGMGQVFDYLEGASDSIEFMSVGVIYKTFQNMLWRFVHGHSWLEITRDVCCTECL